jgi:V/A-type H+-transporting ATPase subunit F
MDVTVVGSAPAVWGFALAGVQGQIAETAEELERALDDVLARPDVGILLITEDVAALARERIDALVARSAVPLVVEIPGPEGPSPDRPSIQELLRHTIGVRV